LSLFTVNSIPNSLVATTVNKIYSIKIKYASGCIILSTGMTAMETTQECASYSIVQKICAYIIKKKIVIKILTWMTSSYQEFV
jgi:hypothetical protein